MTREAKDMRKLRKSRKTKSLCTRCGKHKKRDGFSQCDECKNYLVDYRLKKKEEEVL